MKTNILLVSALLASSLFVTSCKKDDDSVAPVTQENNIPNGTVKVGYSVQVLASSVTGRTEGLTGAVVTIQGDNGSKQSATTDATGIASFSNLNEGKISIFVKSPSGTFLSSNTTGTLSYTGSGASLTVAGSAGNGASAQNNTGTDVEVVANNQLTVTLPRLAATVEGKIVYSATTPGGPVTTAASGAKLIIKAPAGYEPNVFTTTVGTDGTFSIGSLPELSTGNLTWDVEFTTDVAATVNTPAYKQAWTINSNLVNRPAADKKTNVGLVFLN